MKTLIVSMMAAAGMMVASSSFASDALFKEYGCVWCHQMEGTKIGPGFKNIAEKYRGDAKAIAKLETKIAKGSSGVWGAQGMPQNDHVPEATVRTMVTHIMTKAYQK